MTKLNPSGTGVVYSTFLGGSGDDCGNAIAVDGLGNAYLTGRTGSSNFPTTSGAFDTSWNGSNDVFVTKLNPSGTALVYSTYLGGGDSDEGTGIAIDGSGNAYITGDTRSTDFPTNSSAFDTSYHDWGDVFVSKLNANGTALVYSTYLGGGYSEYGYGIAVDGSGNAYITGRTYSTNFPTTSNAFDTSWNGGDTDVFVTKLNPSGSALVYSTYLGGEGIDGGYGIAIDGSGNAYINGATSSSDFPTTSGAFSNSFNGFDDVFVTKLNPSGTAVLYSTFLGGGDSDISLGIVLDGSRNAYITGWTQSRYYPTTPGAFNTMYNGCVYYFGGDVFVTKISAEYIPIELIDFQTILEN